MGNFRSDLPLGTTDVKVLLGNASNFDEAMHEKILRYWLDRFGRQRLTWHGMEERFQEFLINSGYQDIGDYVAGLELTARNQMFHKDGELYRASAALALPYTLTGDWAQEKDLFVAMGDAVLRQDLARGSGADLVGFGDDKTVADLSRAEHGDSMIAVKQPVSGSLERSQHEKNLDHVTVADFGVPESPLDATPFFTQFEGAENVKTVDLLGGEYKVTGVDLRKFYYNGNILADGKYVVQSIDKYQRVKGVPQAGLVPFPVQFDNRLGASIVYMNGRFQMSDVYYVNDWARSGAGDEVFVSYLMGSDSNQGTREQPYKTLTKVFSEAKTRHIRAVMLDQFMPRQASGHVARDSVISINFNLKLSAGHSSGECIVGSFNDPDLFEWERVGTTSVYKTTATLTRSVFDSQIRDGYGMPSPLLLKMSLTDVEQMAGTWYYDSTNSTVYVHLRNHRKPQEDVLVCQAVGCWSFDIPVDGAVSLDGIKSIFVYGQSDGVRITPRSTSPNTARFAARNSAFIGADYNGLSVSRISLSSIEKVTLAYNARDGVGYHDSITPSPIVAYESGCVGYENGAEKYAVNPSNTGSDNASTAHRGMTIIRSDCEYPESKDGVVADVNGCISINYGVRSGLARSVRESARASFYFNNVDAARPSQVFLIGCSGGGVGTYSISTDGDPLVDVRVDRWLGDISVFEGAVIRCLNGDVVK